MARGKKNARRLKAHLAFLDESGLLMAPLVRRTWAPVGQTPILYVPTRAHEKVSMVGTITVSPQRRRVNMFFALHPNANINGDRIVEFLRSLLRHLRGHVFLIWDRLGVHKSKKVKNYLTHHSRLHIVLLPPYAPELNPPEGIWSYLKLNPLANFCPQHLHDLTRRARSRSRRIQRDEQLLRSFVLRTPLSSCLK